MKGHQDDGITSIRDQDLLNVWCNYEAGLFIQTAPRGQ